MSENSISGWAGLSPQEQANLKDMQDAAAAFAQTHADPTKFSQPPTAGSGALSAFDPDQPEPPRPSPMAPLPGPTEKTASNSGALRFEGKWVKNSDGSLQFVKTQQWREP